MIALLCAIATENGELKAKARRLDMVEDSWDFERSSTLASGGGGCVLDGVRAFHGARHADCSGAVGQALTQDDVERVDK
jgi:hypothetical protein